ncbi:type II secretion system F family protein [Brevibacillus humidisoli]|uniref:type II secretion system F family protein n=1 Tax=Brevibacillus humidisoli TaxID=2895522 RepID=UPI001E5DB73E|nr:type II secretion system F family protein [Brevibacillus humidisoli]UFJ40579.1 type II secretion system F family protein [Brevibacillus humidisoli]
MVGMLSVIIGLSAAIVMLPKRMLGRQVMGEHTAVHALLRQRKSAAERFAWWLEKRRAGFSAVQYLLLCLLSGGGTYYVSLLILQSWWMSLPTFLAGILICERLIGIRQAKRIERFEEGNIRALRIMASSLRTSPSYRKAFEMIACSPYVPKDVRTEYARIVELVSGQVPLEAALQDLQARTGSGDIGYLATIVLVQRDSGGDMAKTLDLAASSILRRKQLQRRQRAAMSQLLAQVNLLSTMPFLFVITLYLNNPAHFEPLTQTIGGRLAVLGCFLSILLGGELIRFLALRPFRQRGEW